MFLGKEKMTIVLAGIFLLTTACESRTFSDAPTATAPERAQAEPASAPTPAPTKTGGSQDLPPDHPPVGAGNEPPKSGVQSPPAGPKGMSPEQFGKTGPLRWKSPDNWRAVKPASSMRLAEYHLPAEQGGEPATLTAFYFGKGGGGSIQANVDRWVGQFKKLSGEPEQKTRTVNGLKVHLVDATGTFTVGAAMGGGQAQSDWRMRGAIVESPAGNFFFKLTGPQATVTAHESSFETFLSSFQAAEGSP
jgi:hypothetical protein